MKLCLFDLDGTLLPGDSDHAFGEFVLALGWADAAEFKQRNDAYFADYNSGTLDIHAYVDFVSQPWRRRPPAEFAQAMARFASDVVQPMIRPVALELVASHQAQGDLVAIVTATNDVVTRPIANALGVQHLLATELQRDTSGQVTGRIQGVPCFRAGKIDKVGQWLQRQGLSWSSFDSSTFYSDSTNDLPLLEQVDQPVATNPSPALEQLAQQRGWQVLKLFT